MLPLQGVRVLDLSRLLPGPYCSLILADLGAEVVRIEPPVGGDLLRSMPPMAGSMGSRFHPLNRNKRSMVVDLKRSEGAELFLRLVQSGFDVVLESFRPGVMRRLGLGYEELRAAGPGVILCSISGHGQDGPRRERAGHDLNYVGLSGILGLTAGAGEGPRPPGAQIADVGGGSLMGAVGVLAALHRRSATGEGAWIDISMTEGALAFLSMHLGGRRAGDSAAGQGEGLLLGESPCYSVYRTADGGHVTLAAIEPHFWRSFCTVIGREDLSEHGLATGERGEWVKEELRAVFAKEDRARWKELLAEHDVCCEPVLEGDEVFSDEQHVSRGSFVEVDDAEAGSLRQVACPIRFVGGEPPPLSPAPRLGAHTDEVLGAAGFEPSEIADLRRARVIA